MAKFTSDQIRVATQAWLVAYRLECVKRGMNVEKLVPAWEHLMPRDRQAIENCVIAALKAADPANVQRVLEREGEG